MRVAALSPQFVHETPEEPQADAKRVVAAAGSRDRTVREVTADEATRDALDERTRAGIRRLSELIVLKTREEDPSNQHEAERRPPGSASLRKSKDPLTPTETEELPTVERMSPLQTHIVYYLNKERALGVYRSVNESTQDELQASGQFLKLAV